MEPSLKYNIARPLDPASPRHQGRAKEHGMSRTPAASATDVMNPLQKRPTGSASSQQSSRTVREPGGRLVKVMFGALRVASRENRLVQQRLNTGQEPIQRSQLMMERAVNLKG